MRGKLYSCVTITKWLICLLLKTLFTNLMGRLINYKIFYLISFITTIERQLRRTLVLYQFHSAFISRKDAKKIKPQRFCVFAIPITIGTLRLCVKSLILLCVFVSPWFNSYSQRLDINLNDSWQTSLKLSLIHIS